MKTNPLSLIRGVDSISSLPIICNQINEAVNDPRSSMLDIGRVIGQDTGLTARLLRIANSAFYNFPSHIETISHAITIIGIQQLRDLVLATSVIKLFKNLSTDLVNMESFWRHSIACGIAARVLATYRREANVERFFVAGLLHDIGHLIIYTKIPDQAEKILSRCKTTGELLYEAEFENNGFTHAAVGELLLKNWMLPASLSEAVAFHHEPQKSHNFFLESSFVHLADLIAHTLEIGCSGENLVRPLCVNAWECLGLSANILPSAVDQIDQQFNETSKIILGEE